MIENLSSYSVLESVKRSVVVALRKAFKGSYRDPDDVLGSILGNIDMEYPEQEAKYPGIWVRFSFSELKKGSLDPTVLDELKSREFQFGQFKGTVTLFVVALSSRDRDRISGALIHTLLFGRLSSASSVFYRELSDNELVYIIANEGSVKPGGQGESVGAPWDPDLVVYEDSYSFAVSGQFASRITTGELARISDLQIVEEMSTALDEWV